VPRTGYKTQPRVSTLGIVHQERRALKKGRQIERPNEAEARSDGPIVAGPKSALCFCAAIDASFIWYPHLSPLQATSLGVRRLLMTLDGMEDASCEGWGSNLQVA
jgi:hypothetical protein